jgi:hypothetical protein
MSVKNSSTSSLPYKSKSSKSKQPLAYVSTDLDDDASPTYTPDELKQLKSTQTSKAYVDGLLYRNRKSGRQTLLNRNGVPMFSGFIDWFTRKRLREKKENGERYVKEKDEEGGDDVEGATTIMLRIDPVESGFMAKKAE